MKKNDPMRNNVYIGKVLSVYDADTIIASVKIGLNIEQVFRIRINGIDTPEIKGKTKKKGLESKEKLKNLIENQEVILKQAKDNDKYGRLLAEVYFNGTLLSDWLIKEGLGKEYHGENKNNLSILSIVEENH